jgi:hypothetical protein
VPEGEGPRIRDHDVEPAERRRGRLDGDGGGVAIGEVGGEDVRDRAARVSGRGRLQQRRLAAGDQREGRPLLGKALDRRQPDAAGRAGEEDPPARQPRAHGPAASAARAAASPGTPCTAPPGNAAALPR